MGPKTLKVLKNSNLAFLWLIIDLCTLTRRLYLTWNPRTIRSGHSRPLLIDLTRPSWANVSQWDQNETSDRFAPEVILLDID